MNQPVSKKKKRIVYNISLSRKLLKELQTFVSHPVIGCLIVFTGLGGYWFFQGYFEAGKREW